MLDRDYKPLAAPDFPAVRPRYPSRVGTFVYACGRVAAIMDGKMTSGNATAAR